MTSSTQTRAPDWLSSPAVRADIDRVEQDLLARLDMLNEDNDLVVVAGLVAAGKVDPAVLDEFTAGRFALRRIADLAGLGIPESDFARFEKLWYHFRVPYARASLVWWYLLCLALGREGEVVAALGLLTRWLGELTSAGDAAVVIAGELVDLPGPVVVTAAEGDDLAALVEAARRRAPLIAVGEVAEAVRTGRDHGREVLETGGRAGDPWLLWQGTPVDLRAVPDNARRAWRELAEADRTELFAALEQRVTSVERVRLLLGETLVDNRGMADLLARCRTTPVDDWPPHHLALATLAWCWQVGGFVLQELNQSFVSFPALTLFMVRRIREYARTLRTPELLPAADHAVRLAGRLGELRRRIEERYERCLFFDGSNWERREFLLPLPVYTRIDGIPDGLRRALYDVFGVDFPGTTGSLAEWDRFVELALENGHTPTRMMQQIAHWAANTDDLWVDLAIFTVPLGRKLDQPWTMDFTDLFCYTGFRTGFGPEEFGIPLDLVGVHNVVGQRMRYNAVKKAQNYAPVRRFPPQGFNLPDIAIAEDANHAGHAAAGIRLACRIPTTVSYRGHDWRGLADVRLNRAEYHRDNRFQPRDLITAYRYSHWSKGIADAAYRRDLGFDEKWGNKVKDLEL